MFRVILSDALGAGITDNVGDGTITDNDVPAISINDVTVSAGDGSATFTVSTGVRLQSPSTIDFGASEGGVLPDFAIAPADYTPS